jgi:hydrogenase maturation factor HypF (carbamoyltransferase family)
VKVWQFPSLQQGFTTVIAHFLLECCNTIYRITRLKRCAQRRSLAESVFVGKNKSQLEQNGFRVLIHHQVPANDGGIALGRL